MKGVLLRYRPELDGLRACAVAIVVAIHAKVPLARGGSYGVDVFFVLSGYLITQLLLAEWGASGGISLRRFYIRRALRLYPALLLFLAVYMAAAVTFFPAVSALAPMDSLLSALYLTDYTKAFTDAPYIIGHTWSLSVEEHFYVLWPLALLFMLRRMSVTSCAKIMFGAFLAFTAWRMLWVEAGQLWAGVYYRFDTRASGLSLGCAYALFMHGKTMKAPGLLTWLGAALILLGMQYAPTGTRLSLLGGFTLIELSTLAVIHGLTYSDGLAKAALSLRPLEWFGRLSYGIYLWHYPIVYYMHLNYGAPAAFFGGGTIALTLSAISYATVERVTRRISTKLKYQTYSSMSSVMYAPPLKNVVPSEPPRTKIEPVALVANPTE